MASTNANFVLGANAKACQYPLDNPRFTVKDYKKIEPVNNLIDVDINSNKASQDVKYSLKELLTVGSNSIDDADTAFVCTHCGQVFSDHIKLRMHEGFYCGALEMNSKDTSNGDKSVGSDNGCVECVKSFTENVITKCHCSPTHNLLQQKIANCSEGKVKTENKKLFECSVCGQHFQRRSYLQLHMRLHSGERPYKCSVCSKEFQLIGHITTHMTAHSHIKNPPSKCSVCIYCGHAFNDSKGLQMHQRSHCISIDITSKDSHNRNEKVKREVKKPFECSVCGQLFEKRSYLLLHMRLHTGERPYKCSICSKEFRLIGHITTHMSTHIKDRPFECSICHKKFARADYMKKHMITHTGEKPYVCSVCNRAFALKGNLERHMMSHIKEKHYSCEFCNVKYAWEKSLHNHMKKIHGHVIIKPKHP